MKLTPEDLEKLQTKQLANVIRKLNSGKTLTAREEALLAQSRVGGSSTAESAFAATWDDLAKRLGVTRRAIQEWRKDPRYSAVYPKDRADGRHDVTAWADFMVKHGLKRADESIDSNSPGFEDEPDISGLVKPPLISGSVADWNKAIAQKEYEKREVAIETLKGSLILKSELEGPLGATFAAIQVKLSQFPERAARRVTGFTDVQEVEARLREEIEADLTDLHATTFLDVSIVEIVATLPFDAETESIFKLITFDGQDREKMLALIAAVATEALRRLGEKMLANLEGGDSVTGKITPVTEKVTAPETQEESREIASKQCKIATKPCKSATKREKITAKPKRKSTRRPKG